jgi:hypothetical protein
LTVELDKAESWKVVCHSALIFFVASLLDNEKFDDETLLDFVHEWLGTESDDTKGRFTIIRTLDNDVFVLVL